MITMIAATAIQLAQESIIMDCVYEMESSRGRNCIARFEPGFLKRYGDKGNMPVLRKKFGDRDAASSFGPLQIMLSTAYQYGFRGTPKELANPTINFDIGGKIIHKLAIKANYDPGKVFDLYNGGGNQRYREKAMKIYNSYLERK